MSYVFNPARLDELVLEQAGEFRNARPYPHAIFDEFLRTDAAQEIATRFPRPENDMAWDQFGAQNFEVKLASSQEERFPDFIREAIHQLNSDIFVGFLERLTGIEQLLPDPHLTGGGLHLSRRGDHLGIHADFNWHEKLQAHRRLNLLIYLTPQWQAAFGGELELWDSTASQCEVTVPPLFNRAVLFVTRSDTFHGHPRPWAAPPDIYRQSIALYYYSHSRPPEEMRDAHSTLYKGYHV